MLSTVTNCKNNVVIDPGKNLVVTSTPAISCGGKSCRKLNYVYMYCTVHNHRNTCNPHTQYTKIIFHMQFFAADVIDTGDIIQYSLKSQ
jgi:hypothetical protein